jgi:hypothetical protein
VLEKVEEGMDVIVERDRRPVATIRTPKRSGRLISACIASAKASGSQVVLDAGFGNDVEEGIRERSKPWDPPSWEGSSIRASSSQRNENAKRWKSFSRLLSRRSEQSKLRSQP